MTGGFAQLCLHQSYMNRRPWKEKDIIIVTNWMARTVMYSNGIPLYTVIKTPHLSND